MRLSVRSSVRSKARTPSKLADEVCEAIKTRTAKRTAQSYGAQWIMVATIQQHLDLPDEQVEAALRLATERGHLCLGTRDGSISLRAH
jgi:hypothetical protein